MSKVIATVRLAAGRVAYYDDLTRIHLTINNPMASITENMNLTKLKKAVRNKSLTLVSGSLEQEVNVDTNKYVAVPETKKGKQQKVEPIEEIVQKIEVPKEEPIKEIVEEPDKSVEDSIEETVEEVKTTKRRKKKEE